MHPIGNIMLDECVSLPSPKRQDRACAITAFYLELTHPSRGVEVNLEYELILTVWLTQVFRCPDDSPDHGEYHRNPDTPHDVKIPTVDVILQGLYQTSFIFGNHQ